MERELITNQTICALLGISKLFCSGCIRPRFGPEIKAQAWQTAMRI
jgi:hypothetical protein